MLEAPAFCTEDSKRYLTVRGFCSSSSFRSNNPHKIDRAINRSTKQQDAYLAMKLFSRFNKTKTQQAPSKKPTAHPKEDVDKLNQLVQNLNATIGKVAEMPEVKEAMDSCDDDSKLRMKKSVFLMKCMHTKRPTRKDLTFVEEYPDICAEKDCWGCTPLAYILHNDPPLDTVQYVVEKYPAAVRMGNLGNAMYPIHKAVYYGASAEVVEFLLQQWPEGAMTFTSRKMLPLHMACSKPSSIEVIDVLLRAYPKAASIPMNQNGELPLFKACFCQASLDVIQALIAAYPKAVSTKTKDGCYPITALCGNKDVSLESVKHLVELFPKAIKTVDGHGGVTLHHACFKGADLAVAGYLIDHYPQSLFLKTKNRKTCRALAEEAGYLELAAFLKKAEQQNRKVVNRK